MTTTNDDQRPTWHGKPGPGQGPQLPIEDLLCRAYYLLADASPATRERLRTKKTFFCAAVKRKGLRNASRPALNQYLDLGALPWPLPPDHHLVYVVDGETHRLRWVNQRLADLFGKTRDELTGRPMLEALHPDEHILSSQPQYLPKFLEVQQRANERAEHPERKHLQLGPGEIDQVQIETRFVGAEGTYVVLLRISYGCGYNTWFVDGEILHFYPSQQDEGLFNVEPDIKLILRDHNEYVDVKTVDDLTDLLRMPVQRQMDWYAQTLRDYRFPSDEAN